MSIDLSSRGVVGIKLRTSGSFVLVKILMCLLYFQISIVRRGFFCIYIYFLFSSATTCINFHYYTRLLEKEKEKFTHHFSL